MSQHLRNRVAKLEGRLPPDTGRSVAEILNRRAFEPAPPRATEEEMQRTEIGRLMLRRLKATERKS